MSADLAHPPHPRAIIRIGVTGHRVAPKLPADRVPQVAAAVDTVLVAIMEAANAVVAAHKGVFLSDAGDARPEGVIISALAEGADQIVAEAGLARGFALDAVLPFDAENYVTDFEASDSAVRFHELLAQTRATFVLSGSREDAARAYQAAGLVTLANSDMLIAIWDGKSGSGRGGTAEIVARAVVDAMPVVLIDPARPERPEILWAGFEPLPPASVRPGDVSRRGIDAIGLVVEALLAPPKRAAIASAPGIWPQLRRFRRALFPIWRGGEKNHGQTSYEVALSTYLAEGQHLNRTPLAQIFPRFQSLLRVRKLRPEDRRIAPFVERVRRDWAGFVQSCPPDVGPLPKAISETLLPAFAFADRLAVHYALLYRGAFVASYLLAALAVLLALIGLLAGVSDVILLKAGLTAVEIGIIGLILWIIVQGTALRWHARFLEYRRLAEVLRPMRMLALVAAPDPVGRAPGTHEAEASFVPWYARAIRRAMPLPNATADAAFQAAVREAAANCGSSEEPASEIEGQIRYHETTAGRMQDMEHTLHLSGEWLFRLTLYIGALLLLIFGLVGSFSHEGLHAFHHGVPKCLKYGATFLMALFPTLGAALSAIRVQGDFGVYAERSRETAAGLKRIHEAMMAEAERASDGVRIPDHPAGTDLGEFALLSDRISKAADTMQGDLTSWHALSRTRPLSLPA